MDFLKEFDISEETITKIENNNDRTMIFNFICSKDEVIKNIEYLKSIGIKVIDLLLIYRLELFMIESDKVKEAFDNYDISTLVQLINEDINAINIL